MTRALPPRRRRIAGFAAVGVLFSVAALVLLHDARASFVQFDRGLLCQRDDGSFWRDASFGCVTDDPQCWPEQCSPSVPVAEGARRACTWLFFEARIPPTGPRPYFRGEAPGAGCTDAE